MSDEIKEIGDVGDNDGNDDNDAIVGVGDAGESADNGDIRDIGAKKPATKKKGTRKKTVKSGDVVGKKVEKMEKVEVTVEMERHTMIEYDRKGYDLVFEIDPLKELPEEVYRDLSHKNQLQYTIAQQNAKELIRRRKQNEGQVVGGPKISTRLRTGQALNKINAMRDDAYFHYYWAAPHEVDECEDTGYTKHLGMKTIMREGKAELIPMKIPVERYEKHQAEVAKESRSRIRRSEEEFLSSSNTNAPGMKPLNQTTRTRVKLSDLERGK